MTNIKCSKEQLSTCKTRQLYNMNCRDCKFDETCDPDFRRIMTWRYTDDTNSKNRRSKNGYRKI